MHVLQAELNYIPFWRFSSSLYLKSTHVAYTSVFLILPFAPQIRTPRAILRIPVWNRVNCKLIKFNSETPYLKKKKNRIHSMRRKKKEQIFHFHTNVASKCKCCSIKKCLKGLRPPFNFLKGSLEFSLDPLRT